ncbi:CRISPR system Cascade subunit CasA [Methylobacterium sp. 174MFSha1.1]|uniref:type I-E CRISPR-associated protein Cse1/CasA n=1 Tax=Methylobacterium sp. 174MFSha1.1 TaxID=1502749 RepID=UPI0008E2E4A2|nr:type I-E CRISPR-associated protein Cse1/CasA [Methylobacterium sp. 174MFSha1.1]SFU39522.1 CRISPR system Cascade subunit CasA [Methylobacterium sp. 174MFSha1.1]
MVPPFSLLTEAWIPVLRADGEPDMIRPAALTDDIDGNPVVAPAWGRADFDAATREFWIGLLAAACGTRADEDEWPAWFEAPPTPAALDEAFAPLAHAFVLDGDGPRFGQDREDITGETRPVSQLLIEAPGVNTVKNNLDHFVRRGGVETLSRAGAAMALFTLQTYAPSGGAGHRVSVRGGGPLTTLLIPGAEDRRAPVPLWRSLWLAVPHRADGPPVPERVFPWLVPTRVSDKGQPTTPDQVDPLQAFWGMPRRIRLVVEANPEGRPCDLTGRVDPLVVRHYRTRPHGTSYAGFTHPLSPHYQTKPGEPWLPLHGQPGRIGYRHWVGLVVGDDGDKTKRQAAASVHDGIKRLQNQDDHAARLGTRLIAAGYDMDNMKARDFVESEMPLHLVGKVEFRPYDETVRRMVRGAFEAEFILRVSLKQALAIEKGGLLDLGRGRFWERTEAAFGKTLAELAKALPGAGLEGDTPHGPTLDRWCGHLREAATAVFKELVPVEDLTDLRQSVAAERVKAEIGLDWAMRGYGKLGQTLFKALGLPLPEAKPKDGKTKDTKSESTKTESKPKKAKGGRG